MQRINIVYGVVLVGLVVVLIYNYLSQPKTAYVNTIEVYNNFALKNELEEKVIKVQRARQWMLDSLKINLQNLVKEIGNSDVKQNEKINNLEILKHQYFFKKQQFQEDNQLLAEKYTDQIWKQLNQYVKDYGQKENYEYIFGADGQGKLMHADEAKNITEELKQYVNNRYQGLEN